MAQLVGKKDEVSARQPIEGQNEPEHVDASSVAKGKRGSVPVKPVDSAKSSQAGKPADAVSASLRRAYESTLDEAIPDALLDLLRKLD